MPQSKIEELIRLCDKQADLLEDLRAEVLGLEPDWLTIAKSDLVKVREVPGRKAHPRIAEALAQTRHPSRSDETPWCSAIMCLWMHECGLPHTRSASARSWHTYGRELAELQRGAIAVLWRVSPSSRSGHVALVVDWDDTYVQLLGGNQSNQVCVKSYPRTRILEGGIRWPEMP